MQVVGRSATGVQHPKLCEVVHPDLYDYRAIEDQLQGFDACFFCLDACSAGSGEARYTRMNHDLPLAAANTLARLNPGMAFLYVSGRGTDSGDATWARIKARTEDALLRLPFKVAYMFRPGVVQPLHGLRSSTPLYRSFYIATAPSMGLGRSWPQDAIATESIGIAMLNAVRHGAPKPVLEAPDIRALSGSACHA